MPKHELISLGSGRIKGRNSLKEADEAYTAPPMRGLNRDWHTMVFESGLSVIHIEKWELDLAQRPMT